MNAVDPTVWDIETKAACMESLRALNGTASNPSGLAVCYNLPSLNNATGQFKADLRLYRVAPPTAEWEGIPDGDISADLRFKGAAVTPKGNGRRAALEPRQSPSPSMPRSLKTFSFDGKMTPELVSKAMNLAQLRAYLAPNVTITAVDGNGQRLSTQLSSDDASFVNGLLKDLGTCSTLACTAEEKARPAPFVMPGTSLGIFPTGLLLTCLWALIGLGVVGWGTFGRYKFREQFRRRKQRDGRTGPA
ncbi:MAG: hypothetical protein M1832_004052 [Thelocarpon impressellum]|nr:MAG: hypothetical protein M1832_004052 [Thelocarpon impressellum]